MALIDKHCAPCEGGVPPLTDMEIESYLTQLKPGWRLVENNAKIRREFVFKDFREAIAFVNKIADAAEQENHHPDISIFYNRVITEIWTHAIGGLSENDFILAAKIDLLEK